MLNKLFQLYMESHPINPFCIKAIHVKFYNIRWKSVRNVDVLILGISEFKLFSALKGECKFGRIIYLKSFNFCFSIFFFKTILWFETSFFSLFYPLLFFKSSFFHLTFWELWRKTILEMKFEILKILVITNISIEGDGT